LIEFIIFAVCYLEPLPTSAARVDALRSHGHQAAALRLAVSVVRTMKQQQLVSVLCAIILAKFGYCVGKGVDEGYQKCHYITK
jgi:hypothetical protein